MCVQPVYHADGDETLTEAVLAAIETAAGMPATELDVPLYDAINPDALDALFDGRPGGTVTFAYLAYRVTVHSDGTVSLSDRT